MSRRASPVALVGTLQDHRHTRESWGVATLLIRELLHGDVPFGVSPGVEINVVGGRVGQAAAGERLELHGTWDRNKWGLQLVVEEQISRGIKDQGEASRWLQRLDGVGPKLAAELVKRFGDQLPAILAGEIDAELADVSGISEEKERHIRDSFAELAIAGDLESIRYLDAIGASRYEANKIITQCSKWRRRPKDVLEATPYELMQIKGLGFARVDRLAKAAGCSPTAPARLEAATVYQLDQIVRRGSTMARLSGGRGDGLVGEVLELTNLEDRDLVRSAVRRLAVDGRVVVIAEQLEKGRRIDWVHPAALLAAERSIYQWHKHKTPRSAEGVARRAPAPAPVPAEQSAGRTNGSERLGGEPPRGEGAPTPARTPAAELPGGVTKAELGELHVAAATLDALERSARVRDEIAGGLAGDVARERRHVETSDERYARLEAQQEAEQRRGGLAGAFAELCNNDPHGGEGW